MSVMNCLPIVIPLISSMLALQFFSTFSDMIPVGGALVQSILTLILIYVNTYLFAKIKHKIIVTIDSRLKLTRAGYSLTRVVPKKKKI